MINNFDMNLIIPNFIGVVVNVITLYYVYQYKNHLHEYNIDNVNKREILNPGVEINMVEIKNTDTSTK